MKNDSVMEQHFKLEVSGREIVDCTLSQCSKMLNLAEMDQQIICSIWRRPAKAVGWEEKIVGEHGCTTSEYSGLDRSLAYLQVSATRCLGRGSRNACDTFMIAFLLLYPLFFKRQIKRRGRSVQYLAGENGTWNKVYLNWLAKLVYLLK